MVGRIIDGLSEYEGKLCGEGFSMTKSLDDGLTIYTHYDKYLEVALIDKNGVLIYEGPHVIKKWVKYRSKLSFVIFKIVPLELMVNTMKDH